MTPDIPKSPAHRRPNDEPYYIDKECEECGQEFEPHQPAFNDGWYDQFVCGCEGITMDWPESDWTNVEERLGG